MLTRLVQLFRQSALASLLCVSLAAGAASNVIVVGQAVDLSGPNASIGRDYVAGIKTCFDMVNSAGGINGKRIHYVVRDDRGQPELAAKAAGDLIERDQVDYLLGGVGDDTTQAVLEAAAFKRSNHMAGTKAVEWTVFSQVVPNPNAGVSQIQIEHLNMMRKFRDETVSSLTLEGFAAAKVLAKAIQQSKRSGRWALQDFIG